MNFSNSIKNKDIFSESSLELRDKLMIQVQTQLNWELMKNLLNQLSEQLRQQLVRQLYVPPKNTLDDQFKN
jgi:hypothetical protein